MACFLGSIFTLVQLYVAMVSAILNTMMSTPPRGITGRYRHHICHKPKG